MSDTPQQPTVIRTERGLSIAGTRITLYSIMDYIHAGWSPPPIQQLYNLTDQQIADVMAYINAHYDAVEIEYQQVLRDAEANRQDWEERNRARLEAIAAQPPKPEHAAIHAKLAAAKAKFKQP